ncbi:MAG: NADP-dependent malic enzyme [Fervidicoccaceae archaeon]|nr:NADP-dependent malic enzyme [Fervidicoccaceae archaeon]
MRDVFSFSAELHRLYRGKIEVMPKVPITSIEDYSYWYTPGVAAPSSRIAEEGEGSSLNYTLRWNYVAVISDGSRVLGLGDIGAEAALPVMEGKALLFKYLGGVDAVPLVINEKSPDAFVNVVKSIQYSFGAINLEDIESPKCFYILERLQEQLDVPVWHDDQQGTALVVLAALINALKLTGKKIGDSKIILFGAGAANIATYRYLVRAGAMPTSIVMIDSRGVLRPDRSDADEMRRENPYKYRISVETSPSEKTVEDAFSGADVIIAASRPGPGVIRKEWIKLMNSDPIVFALANPVPEILPGEAREAGARVVATGRSDYPNQVNNSLGFPAVFRGVLSVSARKMTDEMFLAAAHAIASYTEETGLSENRIIASMTDDELYVREALAVAEKAMELGLARRKISRGELEDEIRQMIERPKRYMRLALDNKLIKKLY